MEKADSLATMLMQIDWLKVKLSTFHATGPPAQLVHRWLCALPRLAKSDLCETAFHNVNWPDTTMQDVVYDTRMWLCQSITLTLVVAVIAWPKLRLSDFVFCVLALGGVWVCEWFTAGMAHVAIAAGFRLPLLGPATAFATFWALRALLLMWWAWRDCAERRARARAATRHPLDTEVEKRLQSAEERVAVAEGEVGMIAHQLGALHRELLQMRCLPSQEAALTALVPRTRSHR